MLEIVQKSLREHSPRFLDVATGRQWGKTTAAEAAIWMALLAPPDEFGPPAIKVIADKYEHANLIWDKFIGHLFGSEVLKSLLQNYSKERELVVLKNGATIQKLSADNPNALTGYTLTMAVVDESAFVQDAAIEQLLPCLAVRQGTILAFGTAEGSGWHRTWFLRGQDPNYEEYWSTTYKSTDNPYFPEDELKVQEYSLPMRRYRQLYLAEWQAEAGAVFHNIHGCIISEQALGQHPEDGRQYAMGVDLGRHNDFTVVYVMDTRTSKIVHQDRFTLVDWMSQVERVERLSVKFNHADVICDSSGAGDVFVELLGRRGVNVIPYTWTPASKDRLIQRLVVALEREEIHFPNYPQLIRELSVYESRVLASGRVQTGAPIGYHDDCVGA